MTRKKKPHRPEKKVLTVAIAEASRRGIQGLASRTIAKKAGTSASTIATFWGSQKNLAKKIIEDEFSLLESNIRRRVSLVVAESGNSDDIIAEATEGVFDALDEDYVGVSAAVLLVLTRIGTPIHRELRKSSAYRKYVELLNGIELVLRRESISAKAAAEATHIIVGALTHRLILATPMLQRIYASDFSRKDFVQNIRNMVRGLVNKSSNDKTREEKSYEKPMSNR
jgi:AcrR family transcriptional regulator